jgi:hypothetical protein
MSTKSSNLTSNINSIIENQIAPDILLQSIDPLVSKLRIHIVDFVLNLHKSFTIPGELTTIGRAAKKLNIHRSVLYTWIDRGILTCYYVDDFRVVSISEIKNIIQTVYKPKQKNKDSIKQSNNSIESL